MTPLTETVQDDWQAGGQQDIAPNLIDQRGFLKGTNVMLDYAGVPYKRGGSAARSETTPLSSARWVWNGELPPGERTVFSGPEGMAVLAGSLTTPILMDGAPAAPTKAVELAGYLFIGSGKVYAGSLNPAVPPGPGTIAVTNGSKAVVGTGTFLGGAQPGDLLRIPGERVYAVAAVADNTHLTLLDTYKGTTSAGHTYELAPTAVMDSPYFDAETFATIDNRLVLAIEPNIVRVSKVNDPHTYDPTDFVTLPEGVRIIGMAPVRQDLLIFTTKGIWLLRGLAYEQVDALGNPQWSLTQVSDAVIAWGHPGLATYSGAVVCPTVDGCVVVDSGGVQSDLARYAVRRLIGHYARQGYKPGNAVVYRDTYFLPILDATNHWIDTLVCRLDLPVRARGRPGVWPWTQLTGSGATVAAYATRTPHPGDEPQLLGACSLDGLLLDLSGYFEPDEGIALDHDGTVPEFILITRDYPSAPGATGRFKRMRLLYEMVATDAFPNPRLHAGVGTAGLSQTGAQWDEVNWDEFEWEADDVTAAGFEDLAGAYGPDPAINKGSWNLSRYAPFARFKISSTDPVAKLTIRSLELFTVEPGSARRARSTTTR